MNIPKRRILLLVFTVLCFKKSLLIRIRQLWQQLGCQEFAHLMKKKIPSAHVACPQICFPILTHSFYVLWRLPPHNAKALFFSIFLTCPWQLNARMISFHFINYYYKRLEKSIFSQMVWTVLEQCLHFHGYNIIFLWVGSIIWMIATCKKKNFQNCSQLRYLMHVDVKEYPHTLIINFTSSSDKKYTDCKGHEVSFWHSGVCW